jgi:hypothetical protein
MFTIRKLIQDRGLTQAKAAKLFGVAQPRISVWCGDASSSSVSTLWWTCWLVPESKLPSPSPRCPSAQTLVYLSLSSLPVVTVPQIIEMLRVLDLFRARLWIDLNACLIEVNVSGDMSMQCYCSEVVRHLRSNRHSSQDLVSTKERQVYVAKPRVPGLTTAIVDQEELCKTISQFLKSIVSSGRDQQEQPLKALSIAFKKLVIPKKSYRAKEAR